MLAKKDKGPIKYQAPTPIWEDYSFGAELASGPIDEDLNQEHAETILGSNLSKIMEHDDALEEISTLAFQAADASGDGNLDQQELGEVMKEVAIKMKIKPPTDLDVKSVLVMIDDSEDREIDKDEFFKMVKLVLKAMLESEQDMVYQNKIEKDKRVGAETETLLGE